MIRPNKKTGIAVGVLAVVVIGIVLVIWQAHRSTGNGVSSLAQTYCSVEGKVCVSYPKNWRLTVTTHGQATITDQTTGTSILYSPQLYSASDPCGAGACLFKTLSAVISNGFSNANDISGVFQQGSKTFIPEYFLVATTQLLDKGLGSVGTTVDIKQTSLDLGFINGSLTQLDQSLEISPPTAMTFTSLDAAQNWLHSASAETAIAIVNSARPQ